MKHQAPTSRRPRVGSSRRTLVRSPSVTSRARCSSSTGSPGVSARPPQVTTPGLRSRLLTTAFCSRVRPPARNPGALLRNKRTRCPVVSYRELIRTSCPVMFREGVRHAQPVAAGRVRPLPVVLPLSRPGGVMSTGWALLLAAGVVEIAWAQSIPPTEGFTRFWPSLLCLALCLGVIYLLALAVVTVPVSTAYVVFTGI